MGIVNVTLGDGKKLNLILGQQLENAVTAVVFDFSAWQTEFGSGTLGLSVQRHGDTQPYAVVPTVSGTNATWNISELDTAYKGVGEVQVTYTVGTKVKKSVVYKFTVQRSLGENGEYPSPGQTWQEEIEDELADVKQDLSDITTTTNNLFDAHDIVIGTNASGTTGFPARAISGAMHVGSNQAKIKVISLPQGIKFEVNIYTGTAFNTRTGYDGSLGWVTSVGTYTYVYSGQYIRFLFAKTDNSTIYPSDLVGIKIQVNAGQIVYDYEPYLTANDLYSRKNVNALLDSVAYLYGLLPVFGYQQGSGTGGITYNTKRIISDYVEVVAHSVLKGYKSEDNPYEISINCYDQNKTYISGTNYTDLYTTGVKLGNAKYVRFIIRKVENGTETDLSVDEIVNVCTRIVLYGDDVQPSNLKVMTFNVGGWNYGEGGGIPSSIYNEKLINYRRFFGMQECDIVGLQEFDRLIEAGQTTDARNVLFNQWYENRGEITGSWEAIFSKHMVSNGGNGQISNGRYYVYTYMQFNDKIIYLLNVHLSAGHDSTAKAKRATELQDVLNLVSNHEYFIIFGDFNPEPDEYVEMFEKFTDEGYNIANNGFFGDFWTWTTNRADFDTSVPSGTVYVIDNIITSGNIKINSVEKINTYEDLSSDHIPIVANLSIT